MGSLTKAWAFNGEAPGPVVVVNEGDTLYFTLENMDPAMDHSMDFHAVHTAPNKGFADVKPHENGDLCLSSIKPWRIYVPLWNSSCSFTCR